MNKIALITGASSGIGRATAEKFAENHYDLILVARRKELLQALSEELTEKFGVHTLPLVLDVRNRKAVENVLSGLPDEWKQVEVLVNNAGLAAGLGPVQEGDVNDWERMIDTNIKGLLYVSRTVLPWMVAGGKGHIINMGSMAGKEVYPNGNVYCASKAAVDFLSQGMRMDLMKNGIRVTNIAPGAVETEFSLVRFHGDKERAGNVYKGIQPLTAADVADSIWYAASRPPHVCIHEIVLTPTAQASVIFFHRS